MVDVVRAVNIAVHLIGAIIFPYGVYSHYKVDIPVDVNPMDSAYGQKFKYLTFIDEIIQAFFFILCLILDIPLMETSTFMSALYTVRDYVFTSIAFPIGSFVAITFWSLFLLDRELVMPAEIDQYFPKWLNHVAHTMVFVLPLLELVTAYRKYWPIGTGLVGLLVFQAIYLIWIHIVYYKSKMWVYPILETLGLLARYAFLGSSVVFSLVLYFAGQYINNTVWSSKAFSVKKGN